ncbi:SET domain-containing protein [Trametes versicolor FP-101664 SS1]|uniref:SET domain-containing protein n=1 Tax=Trametes versicolor (strain FP-101664) TaxID=717944 RepID=UPI0004622C28|nr:SET domain-containing protein [Trametes versicolor FP-101664 SS1]EIW54878.1 SET domain-containing protein [Trametes versicolor FP-101664 SS1]
MAMSGFMGRHIPGKGRGLIAARALSRGELILAESPLLVQPPSYTNATILRALSALSDAQQRDYFSLANAHKGVHPPPLGVFKTNALPCGDHDITTGTAAGSGAVFVLGSRFNSSCDPNVNNYWNEGQGKITFWAVRDIAEGEELLISYGEHFAGRDARRARLKMQFGFVCECTACSRTDEDLKASDERRVTIGNLYNEIGQYGAVPAVGIRKVKEAIRLLAEEGLLDTRGASFYYDGFQFCASVSDTKNAKAWATKAWEGYCAVRGPDSTDAKNMKKYVQNPRAHGAFGLLTKKTLSGPE